jgi:hypothetical protein
MFLHVLGERRLETKMVGLCRSLNGLRSTVLSMNQHSRNPEKTENHGVAGSIPTLGTI